MATTENRHPNLSDEQVSELIRTIFRYGPKAQEVPGWFHDATRAALIGIAQPGGETITPFGVLLRH